MKDKINLPETLLHSIDNSYSRDALIELSNSILGNIGDEFLKSDVLAKFPIVGWLAATLKTGSNIRDKLYIHKLLRFLAETSGSNDEDREKFRAKLDIDPDEAKNAGATILDIIDKITNAQKAAMIGKIMRAYMHEDDLSTPELIELCEIIDKAYTRDIVALARPDNEQGYNWNDVNLESVGIKKPMRVEDVNQAIRAAVDRAVSRVPILREYDEQPTGVREPVVVESGFTDIGSKLQTILRTY